VKVLVIVAADLLLGKLLDYPSWDLSSKQFKGA